MIVLILLSLDSRNLSMIRTHDLKIGLGLARLKPPSRRVRYPDPIIFRKNTSDPDEN
jgi:hypothetical protein